jgi:hypothetical protein
MERKGFNFNAGLRRLYVYVYGGGGGGGGGGGVAVAWRWRGDSAKGAKGGVWQKAENAAND